MKFVTNETAKNYIGGIVNYNKIEAAISTTKINLLFDNRGFQISFRPSFFFDE